MRILKEDTTIKESLPVSFITDMMSKGWDEVGYLREASAAIKETYEDTAKVEGLMQDLMDAYLIFIGQLEAYLHEEENIVASVESVKEESTKAEEPDEAEASTEIEADVDIESELKDLKADKVSDHIEPLPEAEFEIEPLDEPVRPVEASDPFEFFTDFDDPDMTTPPLQDSDLYDEHNKPKTMLRG